MSEGGFHVHGPHDHAVERAARGASNHNRMATATAILATVGAIFGYMAGATQNSASMHKNEAAIHKTEASNKWNYYQAKSQKENIDSLAVLLVSNPELAEAQKAEVRRYQAEKAEIKKEAEDIEELSKKSDELSERDMHLHHRWALATTLIQIAIALAAIALLAEKKWLEFATGCAAACGILAAAMALLA